MDEISDSTRISLKRRQDRRSQLLDAMHARLGPQTPGMEKPRVATTQEVYLGPSTALTILDWPPHQPLPQMGGNIMSRGPLGSISRRLDDMLSTSFNPHIINYEPSRGFIVPKNFAFDGSSDPFDHIMHYRQLMALDIGNDALLCKVFLVSL